jgi:predicted TIM-barrel enzyme
MNQVINPVAILEPVLHHLSDAHHKHTQEGLLHPKAAELIRSASYWLEQQHQVQASFQPKVGMHIPKTSSSISCTQFSCRF